MKLFLPQLHNVKGRSSVLLRERVILRVGGGVSGVLLYSKLSFCCHSNGARHGSFSSFMVNKKSP